MKAIIISILIIITLNTSTAAQGIDVGEPGVLSAPTGRYVLGQVASRSGTYMLDTQTGRLWVMTTTTNMGQVLQPIVYQTVSGGYSIVPKQADEELKELRDKQIASEQADKKGKPVPSEITKPQ